LTALRSTASDAAEAGSQKMPSTPARSRCAAAISASVTESINPSDSSRAATALAQDAGLPIRMAVANVWGLATGVPSTRGAAPAAWPPTIRGSWVARPASRYSRKPRQ
jgi:hypothetical protein